MIKNKTISIPLSFFATRYDGSAHPQSKSYEKLQKGANCQSFVYKLLKYFGYKMGKFRSSDLWEDTLYTKKVKVPKPLDILMFNGNNDAYGAHLGLYLENDRILHLSKEVGYPTIWNLADFKKHKKYKNLIGIKRPKLRF